MKQNSSTTRFFSFSFLSLDFFFLLLVPLVTKINIYHRATSTHKRNATPNTQQHPNTTQVFLLSSTRVLCFSMWWWCIKRSILLQFQKNAKKHTFFFTHKHTRGKFLVCLVWFFLVEEGRDFFFSRPNKFLDPKGNVVAAINFGLLLFLREPTRRALICIFGFHPKIATPADITLVLSWPAPC